MELQALHREQNQLCRLLERLEEVSGLCASESEGYERLHRVLQSRLDGNHVRLTRAEESLNRLDSRERSILRARYLEGQSWDRICLRTGYEQAQIFRIHAGALRCLVEAERRTASPPAGGEDRK